MLTTQVQRYKLEKLAGGDLQLIKYLENLYPDLTALTQSASNAQATADQAEANAQDAILQVGVALARSLVAQRTANEALEAALMDQSGHIASLRSYIRILESRVSALENAP